MQKTKLAPKTQTLTRKFEAEAIALQSLRLIAAPNPKDDMSKEQVAAYCRNSPHSPELIQQLIDFIREM